MFTNYINFVLLPSKNPEFMMAVLIGNLKDLDLPTQLNEETGKDMPITRFPLHVKYASACIEDIRPGRKFAALWTYTTPKENGTEFGHSNLSSISPL